MRTALVVCLLGLIAFSTHEVAAKPLCSITTIPRCKEPLVLVCACVQQPGGVTKCDWTCEKAVP
jgi:hypothetical protein